MNSPVKLDRAGAQSPYMVQKLRGMQSAFFQMLKVAGFVLVIASLQAYGFDRHFLPLFNQASRHIDRLAAEISTNTQVDTVLGLLADLRRTTQNEILRTEIVQTYERFTGEFITNPRTAIADLIRVANGFAAQTDSIEADILVSLKQELESLQQIYSDHYGDLNARLQSPPFYLQPTAALIKRDNALENKTGFNHALYLALTGDRSAANTIFNDLKSDQQDIQFMSLVHYAQARMLYDAFVAQNNMEYFQQAIQNLQESLRYNPDYGMPKMFLEYLLSMNRGMQAEDVPQQGEGTGEAEGERGVMSSHPPTF